MIPKLGNPNRKVQPVRATRQYGNTAPAVVRYITPRCPLCHSKNNVGQLTERREGWFHCWQCGIEFNTDTGEIYKIKQSGEVRLMLVDSQTFEVVECKSVRITLTKGDKITSNNIAKMGVYSGFMVLEFADGRQKMYNAALVESVEEI